MTARASSSLFLGNSLYDPYDLDTPAGILISKRCEGLHFASAGGAGGFPDIKDCELGAAKDTVHICLCSVKFPDFYILKAGSI